MILAELDPSFHVSYRDVTFYRNGGDLKDVEICVNFVTTCRSSAEGWSCLGGGVWGIMQTTCGVNYAPKV